MKAVPEIVFTVERDEDGACFVATWDDPSGKGGITTQGEDLRELQEMVKDAATGYFQAAGVPLPRRVRLHFVTDPELALA
jgi:predicted RNase H-like HicB family nuclease